MTFDDLQLIPPLLSAVHTEGYHQPTPIQVQAIPHILAGRDLLGCAQTGTGKTAAFALPILQRLNAASAEPHRPAAHPPGRGHGGHHARPIRVLVLSPTRELAAQIGDSFAAYGRNLNHRHAVIYGGVGQERQVQALRSGVDILVATPGRLLDLMNQRLLSLADLRVFVLDEADRMLDMGFIHDVRRIIAAIPPSKDRQTLLFSATMPADIADLARNILRDPVQVAVVPPSTTAERIDQSIYFVEKAEKRQLLEHLLGDREIRRVLVFTRTKHGANRVAEHLTKASIQTEAIHGNKAQNARERALANFRSGATRVLVATDIAARGIDVDGITHVINFDLPNIAESYVHRIGRTARAGATGIAISFCEQEERPYLQAIQRLIRLEVPVVWDHPYRSRHPAPQPGASAPASTRSGERPRREGGQGRPSGGSRGVSAGRGSGGEGRGDNRPARDARSARDSHRAEASASASGAPYRATEGRGRPEAVTRTVASVLPLTGGSAAFAAPTPGAPARRPARRSFRPR